MRRRRTTVAAVNAMVKGLPELSGSSSMEDQDGTTTVVAAAEVARTTIATEIAMDLGEDVDVVLTTILGNRGTMVGKTEVPTVPVVVGTVTFRGNSIGLAERSNYLSNSSNNNNTNRMEDGRETLEEDGSGTVVRVRARARDHRRIRSGTDLR